MQQQNPDVICLQETKANPDQVREAIAELHGYNLEGQLDIEELNKSGQLDTQVRRVQAEDGQPPCSGAAIRNRCFAGLAASSCSTTRHCGKSRYNCHAPRADAVLEDDGLVPRIDDLLVHEIGKKAIRLVLQNRLRKELIDGQLGAVGKSHPFNALAEPV